PQDGSVDDGARRAVDGGQGVLVETPARHEAGGRRDDSRVHRRLDLRLVARRVPDARFVEGAVEEPFSRAVGFETAGERRELVSRGRRGLTDRQLALERAVEVETPLVAVVSDRGV